MGWHHLDDTINLSLTEPCRCAEMKSLPPGLGKQGRLARSVGREAGTGGGAVLEQQPREHAVPRARSAGKVYLAHEPLVNNHLGGAR